MKYLSYIFRNARRNKLRSLLTIASVAFCLFLASILTAFTAVSDEAASGTKIYNRMVTMSSQGLGAVVPVARLNDLRALPEVEFATTFSWYGGKLGEEVMPFVQFGVDPENVFKVYGELEVPAEQQKAFIENRSGCVIGRKLANERKYSIGDKIPLIGTIYPFNLDLTVVGIYDSPPKSDGRMCFFNWSYLEEGLKRDFKGTQAGNAGIIVMKCKSADEIPKLVKKIDASYANSDTPTKSQSEEAFAKMFNEYFGNLKDVISLVGFVVVLSLIFVTGNAMAMAMRERTMEMSILKAIGFSNGRIMYLVLAEAILISGIGGVIGGIGSKLFFDMFDATKFTSGFLAFFYIPWYVALICLAVSVFIGFASGLIPAVNAWRLSVISGLRKIV